MTKQTKMLLGVGAVAVAGYLIWKQSQKKNFANLTAAKLRGCPCKEIKKADSPVKGWNECKGGQACPQEGPFQPY